MKSLKFPHSKFRLKPVGNRNTVFDLCVMSSIMGIVEEDMLPFAVQ